MKKVSALALMLCFCVFILSACVPGPDMDHLPEGELIKSVDSADGTYRINAYLCDGGSTTDYAVRCEVESPGNDEPRNIYWNYHVEDAEIVWKSKTVVVINGVELDVTKDRFDWRNE